MNGRLTILQLLHYLDTFMESLAQRRVVDVIFFDSQKAIDMIPQKRLLYATFVSLVSAANFFNRLKAFSWEESNVSY